jgi:hypothetical protein
MNQRLKLGNSLCMTMTDKEDLLLSSWKQRPENYALILMVMTKSNSIVY